MIMAWVLIPFSLVNLKPPLEAINDLRRESQRIAWLGAMLACGFVTNSNLNALYRKMLNTVIDEDWTALFEVVLKVLSDRGVTTVTIVSTVTEILVPPTPPAGARRPRTCCVRGYLHSALIRAKSTYGSIY